MNNVPSTREMRRQNHLEYKQRFGYHGFITGGIKDSFVNNFIGKMPPEEFWGIMGQINADIIYQREELRKLMGEGMELTYQIMDERGYK